MFDVANEWKPMFGMMEQYDGFLVPDAVDDECVHSSFDLGMHYLKTQASCGTWSSYVQRSSIEK